MSRAFNLDLSEEQIVKHCNAHGISISMLETLPDKGTRLVCSSGSGAEKIRSKLARSIIKGEVRRERFRPRGPLW